MNTESDGTETEFEAILKTLEETLGDIGPIDTVGFWLNHALDAMRACKPNDKSPMDRQWAICITQLENAICVFDGRVARGGE